MDVTNVTDKQDPITTDERFQRLRSVLKDAGVRPTVSRDRLLRTLVASDKPVSVQELRQLEGGRASTMTTYRLLNDLVALGLAVGFVRGKRTFVLKEGYDDRACYLVCSQCGSRTPFHGHNNEKGWSDICTTRGFHLDYYIATFYGVCANCRAAGEESTAKKTQII